MSFTINNITLQVSEIPELKQLAKSIFMMLINEVEDGDADFNSTIYNQKLSEQNALQIDALSKINQIEESEDLAETWYCGVIEGAMGLYGKVEAKKWVKEKANCNDEELNIFENFVKSFRIY